MEAGPADPDLECQRRPDIQHISHSDHACCRFSKSRVSDGMCTAHALVQWHNQGQGVSSSHACDVCLVQPARWVL